MSASLVHEREFVIALLVVGSILVLACVVGCTLKWGVVPRKWIQAVRDEEHADVEVACRSFVRGLSGGYRFQRMVTELCLQRQDVYEASLRVPVRNQTFQLFYYALKPAGVLYIESEMKSVISLVLHDIHHRHILLPKEFRLDAEKGRMMSVYTDGMTLTQYRAKHPLSTHKIAVFGRQLLEALQYLRRNGLPYLHLTPSTIRVSSDRNSVQIYLIEECLAGVPFDDQTTILPALKLNPQFEPWHVWEQLIVMQFGRVVLSMCDQDPNRLDSHVKEVLESIFGRMAGAPENALAWPASHIYQLPSLDALLSHPLFAQVKLADEPEVRRNPHQTVLCETSSELSAVLIQCLRRNLLLG